MPMLVDGIIRSDAHMNIDTELRRVKCEKHPMAENNLRLYLIERLGGKIAEAFVGAASVAVGEGKNSLNSKVQITFDTSCWDIAVRLVMEFEGGDGMEQQGGVVWSGGVVAI